MTSLDPYDTRPQTLSDYLETSKIFVVRNNIYRKSLGKVSPSGKDSQSPILGTKNRQSNSLVFFSPYFCLT